MKKIIFTLLALVGTMSMNAQVTQVMKIYHDNVLVAKYAVDQANKVVFEEIPATAGKATATIGGVDKDVNWVQLWENGPKFAEYNVGAASATEYGGYYAWGGSQDKVDDDYTGSGDLTGNYDTATNLWGSKWRMPTKAEFEALLNSDNCEVEWTTNYNGTGKNGLLCTGKDAYSSNSVFLPAAGYCDDGNVDCQGTFGVYWSSTPESSYEAYLLDFNSRDQFVVNDERRHGFSVRAVFAE